MICLAEKKDARKIAEIHKQEIGEGFLASLPLSFLEKIYLSVIENDFCVVDKENNDVVGFIAGTTDIKKLYSFFSKKYFFYSVIIFLPKILDIKKIIEDIFYIKKEEIKPELLTIAVKDDFQRRGIAKKMFDTFVFEMRKRNVEIFKVVVGQDLEPAISFYEKNGFKFFKEVEVHRGKKSRIYTYNL
jgi:ribosomal protein S18 acetylase RimI-like enzyme